MSLSHACCFVAAAALFAGPSFAGDVPVQPSPNEASKLPVAPIADRWLELTNTHTGEVVHVVFRTASGLVPDALARLDHVLRDHRTGEQIEMDRALFDLLADLAVAAGQEPRYEIISGYRSPATNAKLAAQGRGVASRSQHMLGRAIDVRLKGYPTAKLRDRALELQRGGVGYYPKSDFVHVDTGRVRRWSG